MNVPINDSPLSITLTLDVRTENHYTQINNINALKVRTHQIGVSLARLIFASLLQSPLIVYANFMTNNVPLLLTS